MITPKPIHSSNLDRFYYCGPHEGWLIVHGEHRDSDTLQRANHDAFVNALQELDPDEATWATEKFGHFAVGWVIYLLVEPGSPAEAKARELLAKLEDYPVLDEEIWAAYELEEEDQWLDDQIRWRTRNLEEEPDEDAVRARYRDLAKEFCDDRALDQALEEIYGDVD